MQDMGIKILFEGDHLIRLLEGMGVTLRISLVSAGGSVILGMIFGMLMMADHVVIRWVSRIYLEFVRIMPQLVLLFLAYFGAAKHLGWDLSGEQAAAAVFTFWGTAEMGDLVRGALQSIPRHQRQSGEALGLTKLQIYRFILVPQALKRLIPQAVNLITRMIKTTSLVVLIGVAEVVKTGQQIIESARLTAPDAALWAYGAVFLLYFAVCWPISAAAGLLEKHWGEEV